MRTYFNQLPSSARGVLWIVLGMSLFTTINALFKQLGGDLPLPTVMFLRAITVLMLIAPFALRRRAAAIRTQHPALHLGRMVLTSLSAACAIYALSHLSLGEVTVYQLTTSIWMIPLGLLFLGEAVRPMRWLGVAVGFVGVVIVAQPDISGINLALLAALAGALADGGLGVLLKRGSGSESMLAIMWWTFLGQALVFGAMSGFVLPAMDARQWLALGLLGSISIACMSCFVRGYRATDASLAETGCFSGLVIGPLLGWALFGEVLGSHYWAGSALLIGGILIALFEPDWRKWLGLQVKVVCEG